MANHFVPEILRLRDSLAQRFCGSREGKILKSVVDGNIFSTSFRWRAAYRSLEIAASGK